MEQEFTVDYYIEKFSKIPDDLWNSDGKYSNKNKPECKCALGHCGYRDGTIGNSIMNDEGYQLSRMFNKYLPNPITNINDGYSPQIREIYGQTPKERVLKALSMIKEKQNAEVKS